MYITRGLGEPRRRWLDEMAELKGLLDLLKDYGVTSLLIVLGIWFAWKYVPQIVEAFIGLMNQLGDNNAKLTKTVDEQAHVNAVLPHAISKTHNALLRGAEAAEAAALHHSEEMHEKIKPHTEAIRRILTERHDG